MWRLHICQPCASSGLGVVLTGDAAWCATPITGYGTTLAITGAYVLAQGLIRLIDVRAAVAAYEQTMRPMVEDAQRVPKLAPRLANNHTRLGIRLLHGLLKIASRPAVHSLTGNVFGGRSKDVDLARYDMPISATLPLEAPAVSSRELLPVLALSAVAVVLGLGMLFRRHKVPNSDTFASERYRSRRLTGAGVLCRLRSF